MPIEFIVTSHNSVSIFFIPNKAELLQLKPYPFICMINFISRAGSLQRLFGASFFQAVQAVKIKFKIDKDSSSKIKFKNQFCEIQILKNQVQINKCKNVIIVIRKLSRKTSGKSGK